jgi:hypothetical protein
MRHFSSVVSIFVKTMTYINVQNQLHFTRHISLLQIEHQMAHQSNVDYLFTLAFFLYR